MASAVPGTYKFLVLRNALRRDAEHLRSSVVMITKPEARAVGNAGFSMRSPPEVAVQVAVPSRASHFLA